MSKRIKTNAKMLRPHIRWILQKLRLRNYDVMVAILPLRLSKKIGIIPKESKGWTACFMPPNMVWMNAATAKRGNWWMMHVLSHELRHYYQFKTKKFPMTEADATNPIDHTKMGKKEKKRYLNDPREKDAIEFQLDLMGALETDTKTRRKLGV